MNNKTESEEMRPEYSFSYGVRGKHYRPYQQGTSVVLLELGIAIIFKNSAAVNHALRMRINLASDELKRNIIKELERSFLTY